MPFEKENKQCLRPRYKFPILTGFTPPTKKFAESCSTSELPMDIGLVGCPILPSLRQPLSVRFPFFEQSSRLQRAGTLFGCR